jgi:membrane protein required for colicin V production
MDLNLFDIIVLTLITILGFKGFIHGFVKEVFGLIGIVGGIFIASRITTEVGYIIHNNIMPIENESTRLLVGFIFAIVGFWLIAYFVGVILSKVLNLSGLGIFDKLLGFVFGAGKIFLIFSIIIYALSHVKVIKTKLDEKTKDSIVYPVLLEAGSYIIKLDTSGLPTNVTEKIDETLETTKDVVQDMTKEVIVK